MLVLQKLGFKCNFNKLVINVIKSSYCKKVQLKNKCKIQSEKHQVSWSLFSKYK